MTSKSRVGNSVTPLALLVALGLLSGAQAENLLPSPEDILSGLLPDEKAEGVFKSWKGLGVKRAEKAESEEIPSFTVYVTFEFGKSDLTTDGELVLSQLGLALIDRKLREYSFFIAGHTDTVGSDEANLELSQRRANTVRNYLIDNFNVSAKRLETRGYGESKLINADDPEADENRRVEIKNIGPEG